MPCRDKQPLAANRHQKGAQEVRPAVSPVTIDQFDVGGDEADMKRRYHFTAARLNRLLLCFRHSERRSEGQAPRGL